MKTERLNLFQLDRAASLIKEGFVVAFPTETVYGLGVIYDDKDAFNRLVEAKNRPQDKPFSVMCKDKKDIKKVAYVDKRIERIIDTFMPGEITILLKVLDNLPSWVSLGTDKIGVRIPNHKIALELLKKVDKPMLVPSANKSGNEDSYTSEDVLKIFDGEISAVVLGKASSLRASTIVDLTQDCIKLVREGNVAFDKIKKVWEELI